MGNVWLTDNETVCSRRYTTSACDSLVVLTGIRDWRPNDLFDNRCYFAVYYWTSLWKLVFDNWMSNLMVVSRHLAFDNWSFNSICDILAFVLDSRTSLSRSRCWCFHLPVRKLADQLFVVSVWGSRIWVWLVLPQPGGWFVWFYWIFLSFSYCSYTI